MRSRWSNVALAFAVAALALWRVVCVRSGPDIDTDAYAHHMIARAILADPHDLGVHWVWLPLFHYLQVPLIALGGTMDDIRWINVALSAALPLVLFRYVRRTATRAERGAAWTSPDLTALCAALFAAACPIAMQMGTTAQPEPLFALLMLGVAIAFQERHHGRAAAMLGAAVLMRYEAWASLAAIAAITALEPWSRKRGGRPPEPRPFQAWLVVAAPAALILAWAALRRPVDGRWFAFLGQTREFATGATRAQSALDGGLLGLLRDSIYYPIVVPVRVLGPVALLVPFGVQRTLRWQGGRFVLVIAACLVFVSFTWVMRSSLGLDRHFVVAVALYATLAAQGAAALADGFARIASRFTREHIAVLGGRAVGAATAGLALAGLVVALRLWMEFWRASIARGWPERTAIGVYLRALPDAPTIFCDDATIEILSGLNRRRFDRHWIDDDHTWSLIERAARADGVAYVATWNRKLLGREHEGKVVFHVGETVADPSSGVAVMRVDPDAGRALR